MNQFLNPRSMSTPGVAGALMMLIANTVCINFPEFPFRYIALILSFVIGAVVFTASTMKVWERGIYWILNSLIIFSMGVGATNIAANVATNQASNEYQRHQYNAIPLPKSSENGLDQEKFKEMALDQEKFKEMALTQKKANGIALTQKKANGIALEQAQVDFFKKW